jgi:hypothetical protein
VTQPGVAKPLVIGGFFGRYVRALSANSPSEIRTAVMGEGFYLIQMQRETSLNQVELIVTYGDGSTARVALGSRGSHK